MDARQLTIALKEEAFRMGFDLAGATSATSLPDADRLEQWLNEGMAGEMDFFARRLTAYRDPSHILPGAKSILMLGMNYRTVEPAAAGAGQGKVSRYAWGADYHEVIQERLRALGAFLHKLAPHAKVRGIVDTAPLLERGFARRAGLGWIGKNTVLINEKYGSWIFLAALLTTEELQYDEPIGESRCGDCRMCIDACPTGAIAAPYRIDARICISYLTVEFRGELPPQLKKACGNKLFGCDACQEVCPWNRSTPDCCKSDFQPQAGMNPIMLADLFALDENSFRQRFRHSPLWRIKLNGLLRNAAVVLGNQR
jgi:epoxyqueuosine reductase